MARAPQPETRSTTALPQLKATIPHLLYQYCLRRGISAEVLATRWGVSAGSMDDPDAWVPYEQGLALWDALIDACPNEALGVQFGITIGFIDLGVVGLAAAHASTIEEAFATFAPLRHLVDPGLELELKEEAGRRVLVCSANDALRQRIHPMEAMLVSTNTGLGRLTQQRVMPTRVEFATAARGPTQAYLDCFDLVPEVTQRYALTYAAEVWRLPIAGSHPLVLKYLVEHCAQQPIPARAPDSASQRLEQWLRAQTGTEAQRLLMGLRLADAAHALCTSRRDLQRRLTNEGTSFRKIQEEIARERAHAMLQRPETTITEVAYALGYAEPRSFQRACYRWFKAGPGAHRAKQAR